MLIGSGGSFLGRRVAAIPGTLPGSGPGCCEVTGLGWSTVLALDRLGTDAEGGGMFSGLLPLDVGAWPPPIL
jgi:hypothetical protein